MLKRCVVIVFVLAARPAVASSQGLPSASAEFALTGSSFVAVVVRDVDAASSWYQGVFGLDEVNRIDAADGRFSIRLLSGRGLSVELIGQGDAERPADRHLGLFKAGLYVADIDALHRRLTRRGVTRDERVLFDEKLNAKTFVFRDLEGNRLQAFQSCAEPC
jgi:catechol-2,3-dioxygenase